MPKIGEMIEFTDTDTGEVKGFRVVWQVPDFPTLNAVPNTRAKGDTSPKFLLMAGRREFGRMWDQGPDRNGNRHYSLLLDGYPLTRAVRMMALRGEDGFDVMYSAPAAKASDAEPAQ